MHVFGDRIWLLESRYFVFFYALMFLFWPLQALFIHILYGLFIWFYMVCKYILVDIGQPGINRINTNTDCIELKVMEDFQYGNIKLLKIYLFVHKLGSLVFCLFSLFFKNILFLFFALIVLKLPTNNDVCLFFSFPEYVWDLFVISIHSEEGAKQWTLIVSSTLHIYMYIPENKLLLEKHQTISVNPTER